MFAPFYIIPAPGKQSLIFTMQEIPFVCIKACYIFSSANKTKRMLIYFIKFCTLLFYINCEMQS